MSRLQTMQRDTSFGSSPVLALDIYRNNKGKTLDTTGSKYMQLGNDDNDAFQSLTDSVNNVLNMHRELLLKCLATYYHDQNYG